MKIRLGTIEDLEFIICLHNYLNKMMSELHPEDFKNIGEDPEWIKQHLLSQHSDYLLIEDEGEIRGLALVQQSESYQLSSLFNHRYVNLVHLIVSPVYRGCGYGHELLQAAKEWGRIRELEYIELSVLANNQAALMFYEKEGVTNFRTVMRTPIN